MANLLAKEPIDLILNESREPGEHSLKRALGATNLISLGIGAIIGTGIFVLTGAAAAQYAGPAIVFSFILAAVGCVFAGDSDYSYTSAAPSIQCSDYGR
jgi:APA family basic amino acid/polyamine antiporter